MCSVTSLSGASVTALCDGLRSPSPIRPPLLLHHHLHPLNAKCARNDIGRYVNHRARGRGVPRLGGLSVLRTVRTEGLERLAELALALMLPPLALVVASIDTHFLRRFHQYNLGGSVVMVTVPRAADPRSTARGSPGGRRPAVTSPHSSSSLINALPCPVL